jgi:hypothetical protein
MVHVRLAPTNKAHTQRGWGEIAVVASHNKGLARDAGYVGVLVRGSEQIAEDPRPSPIIHPHAHEVGAQPRELLHTPWLPHRFRYCAKKKTLLAPCKFARVAVGDAIALGSQKSHPIRFSTRSSTWLASWPSRRRGRQLPTESEETTAVVDTYPANRLWPPVSMRCERMRVLVVH